MQHTEEVALVAGATVGLGGGLLGAFVDCTLGHINFARALIESADENVNLTALVECQTTTTDAKSV